ncbi:hypothetical protein EV122DRAFT_282727 [Schizophyllum commune]
MDRAIDILGSTNRDPETPRVRGEFGDWSLQYGADIDAERILVGAGNTVMDLAGMASTAALEEHGRRLLHHVVRRDAPPLRISVLRSGRLSKESEPSFVLYFEVDDLPATARATRQSVALLLGKYTIERDLLEGEDGGKHAAHFTFATRELCVHIMLASMSQMWHSLPLQVARMATNALENSPPLSL